MSELFPVRKNHKPTPEEMKIRRAIHVLQDACDDDMVLKQEQGVFLIPAIQEDHEDDDGKKILAGTIEYQVCDGLPGERSHCNSFWSFAEAVKFFNEVVEDGGWKEWFTKEKVIQTLTEDPNDLEDDE